MSTEQSTFKLTALIILLAPSTVILSYYVQSYRMRQRKNRLNIDR